MSFEFIASIALGLAFSWTFWPLIEMRQCLGRTVERVSDLERRIKFLENNEKARDARARMDRFSASGDLSALRDS
jgi:hypothetical protein